MPYEQERKQAWHLEGQGEQAARRLYDDACRSDKLNAFRREAARRDASAVENMTLSCFGANGYANEIPFAFRNENTTEDDKTDDTPIIINVFKAIVNTLTSNIAALNKPKTAVVTSYGKWRDRRNGVKIQRLIEADFKLSPGWQYATLWAMCEHGFKLAHASTGDVAVKVSEYPNSSDVCYELHDTLDFGFDYDELTYGSPMTLHVSTWWEPEELKAHFPDWEDEIDEAKDLPPKGLTPLGTDTERTKMVRVVEGWRLSAADGTPGAYMIVLKNGVDMTDPDDREYDYKTFPVAIYNCDKHLTGPWSTSTTSLVYDLIRIANECMVSMAKAEASTPKSVMLIDPEGVEEGDADKIRDFMVLRRKSGHTTQSSPVESFNPQMFERMNIEFVNWLIELAHNVSGMPQSQTAAIKESGLPSAQAQRQIAALASQRFAQSSSNYIQWVSVDIPKLALRAMKRIHDRTGSFTRRWTKSSKDNTSSVFMREISSDVLDDFDDNRYVLEPAAVGGVKGTPADRVQTALEAVQMGSMSPERFNSVQQNLDTPDALTDKQAAWIENEIDKWMFADPEEVQQPDFYKGPLPQMRDLEAATLQVFDAFTEADIELSADPDEDYRLEFFTQFLTECDALAKQRAQFTASLGQPQQQQAPPAAAAA